MPIRRFLAVPVIDEGRIVAVAAVANKQIDYNDGDTHALTSLLNKMWEILNRRRIQTLLRESENRFQELFDHMGDGVAIYQGVDEGEDFVFVDMNESGQTLSQVRQEEIVGRRLTQVFPAIKSTGLLDVFRRVWQTGKPESQPPTKYSDGRIEHWVENSVYRLPSGLIVAIFADVSAKKKAEEENKKLQAQLTQAQKMEAIGVLAGGIAHDFNNILGIILGFTDLAMQDASPDSPYAKDLDKVLSAANRAKELVKQILTFCRQAGVERFLLKIQPLVKETLKMLRATIPSSISLVENIDPQAGTVWADPGQINQIVMNLCTNAFHAMEHSGGTLTVMVKPVLFVDGGSSGTALLPPGDYVELSVSDTGTGIAPDILNKIFDPYFTTKEVGKGTGMGLAITHGIIRSHNGEITVDSISGQGTTFHVYFPCAAGETPPEIEEPLLAPRGTGRILLVDDEELLLEMEQVILERLGYTVTAHTSSLAALENFLKEPERFDLVITDQTMPLMSGMELAGRLLGVRPDLPVVLCTGFSKAVNEESVKAAGIKALEMKPFTPASIGQLIKKLLQG